MVRKLSISPEESDLSLQLREDDREVRETDPLSSGFPTWSSRMKCLEAYVCVAKSFAITMEHCRTIGLYGSIVFIAYIVIAIVFIVPICLVQIMLGRYVMGNVTKVWAMVPIAKGILACLIGTTAYTIYSNNMFNVYLLKYLFSFYHGHIPWDNCRSPWARENCFVVGDNNYFVKCTHAHSESYCRNLSWESSGAQYWKYIADNNDSIREVFLSAVYLALSIFLVVLINLKGHRSCEKAFVALVYCPLVIAVAVSFASYSSPTALPGIMIFLNFQWNLIYDWRMWLTVFEDFILSSGLGTLALSFVSSHGRFKDNIVIDILLVIFTSTVSSLLTITPILSVVTALNSKYISAQSKAGIEEMFESKTLIFVWISNGLIQMPRPNVLWCFLFYLEMTLLSLGNQTIMMLAICETVWEIFPEKKKILYYSIIVGCVFFALATPGLFIKFDFEFPIQTSITAIILLYAITLQVFYGLRKLYDDHYFMLGYPPSLFFLRLFWMLLIPMTLVVLASKMFFGIPNHPLKYIVFIYVAIPLVLYLIVALVQVIRAAKRGNVNSAFTADPDWGPENSVLKMSRIIFDTRTITKEFIYRQELHRKPLLKPLDFSEQNIIQLI